MLDCECRDFRRLLYAGLKASGSGNANIHQGQLVYPCTSGFDSSTHEQQDGERQIVKSAMIGCPRKIGGLRAAGVKGQVVVRSIDLAP